MKKTANTSQKEQISKLSPFLQPEAYAAMLVVRKARLELKWKLGLRRPPQQPLHSQPPIISEPISTDTAD